MSSKKSTTLQTISSTAPSPTESDPPSSSSNSNSNPHPPFSPNLSGAGGVIGQLHGKLKKTSQSQDVHGKEQERRHAHGQHETLHQKAMKKLDENPAQLGDPISLKAEKTGTGEKNSPTEGDLEAEGGGKPKSRL